MPNIVTVYISLLDEGSPTLRGTNAVDLGNGLYKILADPYYNPEDEIWEFPPNSVVRCELKTNFDKEILLATERAI